MKKFINNVNDVENEMIEGFVAANSDIVKKLDGCNVIVRQQKKIGKVAVVCGGGSGHEPAHTGYVGYGMLDCAVPGAIYTSPTPDLVYAGIKAVDNGCGVLLIITNYTGDIMNFQMGADMAKDDGINVEQVIVNDDVAVDGSLYTVGRRGVAGTFLVDRIAGAMAEQGSSLQEVKDVTEKVIANVRTIGVAIKPSTIPAAGKPGFSLEEDEMEFGIGVHGEPGISTIKMQNANAIANKMLNKILSDIDYSNSEVAVVVNGSGATPLMELYILFNEVNKALKKNNIRIFKSYVGNYMTSIDMAGASISLLKLDNQLKELLNKPANTVAFKNLGVDDAC